VFKKVDKKDRQAKFAATITGACTSTSIASTFEAAQFQAQGMLHRIRIARRKSGFLFQRAGFSRVRKLLQLAIDVGLAEDPLFDMSFLCQTF